MCLIPHQGRLDTSLGRRAFFELLRVLRSHALRCHHESHYRRCHSGEARLPLPSELVWQDFVARLTESERSYLKEHLLHCSTTLPPFSLGYLRRRVRRKILAYLQGA